MNKIRLNEYKSKVMEALDGLDLDSIIQAAEMIASCKGIVWTFGNGQGLAVAESFALDLVKHAGIGSVNLNSPAMMSAYSNDHGYVHWPSAALGNIYRPNDIAIGFSFSGSANIFGALRIARSMHSDAILMTSKIAYDKYVINNHGLQFIRLFITVPSDDIQVVEDVWSSVCHMICNEVRKLK
jgi:phosphoheptose isomerase